MLVPRRRLSFAIDNCADFFCVKDTHTRIRPLRTLHSDRALPPNPLILASGSPQTVDRFPDPSKPNRLNKDELGNQSYSLDMCMHGSSVSTKAGAASSIFLKASGPVAKDL